MTFNNLLSSILYLHLSFFSSTKDEVEEVIDFFFAGKNDTTYAVLPEINLIRSRRAGDKGVPSFLIFGKILYFL